MAEAECAAALASNNEPFKELEAVVGGGGVGAPARAAGGRLP